MIKTKINLKNFFIFNSTFCAKEGEEEKKIMFFYPEIHIDEKLKDIGLVEAIAKFSAQFSLEKTDDVLTMKTQKTVKFFHECEKDFWMVMTLKVPFERKEKDKKEYIEYYADDLHDAVYKKVIHRAYQQFKMFCNTFEFNMTGSDEAEKMQSLRGKLNQFYMKYLVTLNVHNADLVDMIQCIQYKPITHLIFFRIVNFMNLISSIKSLYIKKCIFIYNIYEIIYSSLSPADLCVVNEYLNDILFPKFLQRRNSQSVDSDRSAGCFVTEHEGESLKDSPRIYLEEKGRLEPYRLVVYNVLDLTFVMLLDDKEANLGDEFSNEIKYSIGPQLVVMSKDIQESLQLQQQNTHGSTAKSQGNECDALQEKYIYFNHKNFRFHACLYDSSASGQRENKKAHISSSVMNLLCDLYTKDMEETDENALINSEKEMIIKTYNDYWICSRNYNNRSLYLIFHKSSTLIDIAEDSQRLMSDIVKNVYFTNQQ